MKKFFNRGEGKKQDGQRSEIPDFYGVGSSAAVWINLSEDLDFLRCWEENPVLRAVLEIKARAKSNMILKVKDIKSGEYVTAQNTIRPDAKPLLKLLSRPNPLQSGAEWMFSREVNYGVFGNSYDYGSLPTGFKQFNFSNITSIKQLPPYLVSYTLTGKFWEQSTIEGIVEKYILNIAGANKDFAPVQILHRNDSNIRFDRDVLKGKSKLLGLRKPLSNIEMAFESRNVIIRKRGALGFFSSELGDANGKLPMTETDIKKVQKEFEKYGTLEDQYQYILSPIPLKYQKTSMNIDELKLFEEVSADAMLVCNAFGVPEILLKLYLSGATFENQEASERRLYQGTVIPEAGDDLISINNWLKTAEDGLIIEGCFDHIPVLQTNEKQKAESYKIISEYHERLFMQGAITYSQWLNAIDIPALPEDNIRIWDLTPERLAVIKKTAVQTTQTPQ